ncbi:hypothetical protein EI555_009603, partial [Monodon monoceros]
SRFEDSIFLVGSLAHRRSDGPQAAMSDFVESEAEESEEEYNDEGEVVPRATKKFVEEEDD